MTGVPATYDLAVVGAGVVGLAAAMDAADHGQRVVVVERDDRAVGASVRNFGHICTTAQTGLLRDYALAARSRWLHLAAQHVLPVRECGTLVVARADDEYEVLQQLHELRGDEVELLSPSEVAARFRGGADIVGGALLPMDLRIDPRSGVADIASYLGDRGVEFRWATHVQRVEPGRVVTGSGVIEADRIVLAVGHDVDLFFPETARDAGVQRCALSMMTVADPLAQKLDPAVLSGFSMLRYPAFADCPALVDVRARLARQAPEAIEADMNLMTTALPDGNLILGDTHRYQRRTVSPFPSEADHALLVSAGQDLFAVGHLDVVERWQGVYASAPQPYLVARPEDGVTVLSVTTGIGMTTAFGFVSVALSPGSTAEPDITRPDPVTTHQE